MTLYHFLLNALASVDRRYDFEDAPIKQMERLQRFVQWGEPRRILSAFQDAEAFDYCDPRDRVCGLIRLIDWNHDGCSAPAPDYTISNFQLACHLAERSCFFRFDQLLPMCKALKLDGPAMDMLGPIDPAAHTSSPLRTKHTGISGASIIRLDERGRLCADLVQDFAEAHPTYLRPAFSALLNERNPLDIYTGEQISALAAPEARPGDIIVQTLRVGMVLRPREEACTYRTLGIVVFLDGYRVPQGKYRDCPCQKHKEKGKSRRRIDVMLPLEASAKDIVSALVLGRLSPEDQAAQVLQRLLTVNLPNQESIVRDETRSKRPGE